MKKHFKKVQLWCGTYFYPDVSLPGSSCLMWATINMLALGLRAILSAERNSHLQWNLSLQEHLSDWTWSESEPGFTNPQVYAMRRFRHRRHTALSFWQWLWTTTIAQSTVQLFEWFWWNDPLTLPPLKCTQRSQPRINTTHALKFKILLPYPSHRAKAHAKK